MNKTRKHTVNSAWWIMKCGTKQKGNMTAHHQNFCASNYNKAPEGPKFYRHRIIASKSFTEFWQRHTHTPPSFNIDLIYMCLPTKWALKHNSAVQ